MSQTDRHAQAWLADVVTADVGRANRNIGRILAGLDAVDPEAAVKRTLSNEPPLSERLTTVAVGKAAAAMSRGIRAAFPERDLVGVAVSDHSETTPSGIEMLVTSHPTPNSTSEQAGRRLLDLVSRADDEIVFLISGGGSSLIEVPAAGLELSDLIAVSQQLLAAGVAIDEMNTVRTHLSAIKGGRLGALSRVPLTTVIISDVTGGPAHLVSSGPTVTCPTTPGDAIAVLRRHGLEDRVPSRVLTSLIEAPLPPVVVPGRVVVAADGAVAARGAVGPGATVITTELGGPADVAAVRAVEATQPGTVGILAGETTVEVRGAGTGGRNQHAALAAAVYIEGTTTMFVAFGTDGIDGPTDAAGAVVDGYTAERIRAAGIDPLTALTNNDSHTALDAARALLRTGPTGTNVADLWLVDRT